MPQGAGRGARQGPLCGGLARDALDQPRMLRLQLETQWVILRCAVIRAASIPLWENL